MATYEGMYDVWRRNFSHIIFVDNNVSIGGKRGWDFIFVFSSPFSESKLFFFKLLNK